MINKVVFLLLSEFILLWLQLEIGSWGFPLPLALLGALYLALAYGGAWGIAGGLLSAMALAVLYGGSWNLLYIAIYPLLAWSLNWWIDRHDESIKVEFFMPGVWAGLAGALPVLAGNINFWCCSNKIPENWYLLLLNIIWSCAVSGGVFVLIILLGEALGEFLGLPRFLNRKRRTR